jgi:hypothetical protein
MDFQVNGTLVGAGASEVRLGAPGRVHAQVKVAAYLDPLPNQSIRGKRYDEKPYWDVERARIGDTREVPVELVVNGEAVARKNVPADGQVRDVAFDVAIEKSSWVAVRILPSAHTNPDLRAGGRPAGAGVAAQRGVVPGGGQPMLDTESAAHFGGGIGCGAQGLRSGAGGLSKVDAQ